MEHLCKGQECLTKVAKFGPFLGTILYKSCLFYPHDRPPLLKGHHLGWPLLRGSTVLESQQTPHISPLTGELWGVYCEDLEENWPRYNSIALSLYFWWCDSLACTGLRLLLTDSCVLRPIRLVASVWLGEGPLVVNELSSKASVSTDTGSTTVGLSLGRAEKSGRCGDSGEVLSELSLLSLLSRRSLSKEPSPLVLGSGLGMFKL